MESASTYNLWHMPQVQLWHRGRQRYRSNRWKCYSICPLGGSLPNKDFEKLYLQRRLAGRQRHSDNYCCIRLMVGLHHERYCLVQLKIMVSVMLCNFQDYLIDGPDAIKIVRNHFWQIKTKLDDNVAYVASHGIKGLIRAVKNAQTGRSFWKSTEQKLILKYRSEWNVKTRWSFQKSQRYLFPSIISPYWPPTFETYIVFSTRPNFWKLDSKICFESGRSILAESVN